MNLASKILAASVAFSLSLFAPVVPAVAQDESDLDQAASSPYSAEVQIEEESPTYEEEPNSSSSLSGEGSLDAPGSPNELDATDGEASNESYTLAETTESSEEESSYNKADFYEEDDESAVMMSSDGQRAASISPMYLSDEMKYFAKYESSCNYDQGFSWGDGYHALGYYQFDHRYGLRDFLLACYAYDSATYSMFGQFASVSSADFRDENAIRKNGEFTDLGNKLNAAWHAAYAANPSEFAALQDGWAYVNYYLPAEDYLASRGIDISNRADCVKGLCWGMSNLFGTGGWRKFVGGWTNGYDWNGVWQSSYNWPGCGLNSSMTDREFVTTLCNYVVDNVAVFYKAQPQYHAGWQNRYRNELKDCLSMLKEDGWVRAGSEWKYAEEGVYVTNDWRSIGGAWYWFGSSGNAARSTFAQVDGLRYYFDDSCAMVTGWVSDAGHWYYMNGSGVMQSGWASIDGHWYFLNPEHDGYFGAMATGWLLEGGEWYWLANDGAMRNGWEYIDGKWYWFDRSGVMAKGIVQVGSDVYWLSDTSGAMQTGWLAIQGEWHYFTESGRMATGWVSVGGAWYLLDDEGSMLTGWQLEGDTWYYFAGSGAMQSGWNFINGDWYFLNTKHDGFFGAMLTGWQKDGGLWYFLNESGIMRSGWIFVDGSWYLLNDKADGSCGAMLTGWQLVDGKWYYMRASGVMERNCWIGDYYVANDGSMAVDTWIDGYYVDGSGKWVPGKTR